MFPGQSAQLNHLQNPVNATRFLRHVVLQVLVLSGLIGLGSGTVSALAGSLETDQVWVRSGADPCAATSHLPAIRPLADAFEEVEESDLPDADDEVSLAGLSLALLPMLAQAFVWASLYSPRLTMHGQAAAP